MKFCVDTSVWVSFFRGSNADVVTQLSGLLDQDRAVLAIPVRLELLAGARQTQVPLLQRTLGALQTFDTSPVTWQRVESWVVEANRHGQRFGIADLLIAAIASEQGCAVWSLDSDFERLEKLKFCRCFRVLPH